MPGTDVRRPSLLKGRLRNGLVYCIHRDWRHRVDRRIVVCLL